MSLVRPAYKTICWVSFLNYFRTYENLKALGSKGINEACIPVGIVDILGCTISWFSMNQ